MTPERLAEIQLHLDAYHSRINQEQVGAPDSVERAAWQAEVDFRAHELAYAAKELMEELRWRTVGEELPPEGCIIALSQEFDRDGVTLNAVYHGVVTDGCLDTYIPQEYSVYQVTMKPTDCWRPL